MHKAYRFPAVGEGAHEQSHVKHPDAAHSSTKFCPVVVALKTVCVWLKASF